MSIVILGSTSGSITLQEPAVAGSTVLTLPAVTGTILTTTSPKAGNVIQVVSASYSTQTSNSTNTPADTGLTATITPSSSSSKILVLVNQSGVEKDAANSQNAVDLFLQKNGSNLIKIGGYIAYTNSSLRNIVGTVSCAYLDSPATTSALTYKTQFFNAGANAAAVLVQSQAAVSTITLLEIAA